MGISHDFAELHESSQLVAARGNFAFVLNPFHYAGSLPIEILPGVVFDRADGAQRQRIEKFRDTQGYAGRSMSFLHEPIPKQLQESPVWNRLIPPRTTFWVINFDPQIDADFIFNLAHATQLTDTETEVGAIFPSEEIVGLPLIENPWRIHSFFTSNWKIDAQEFHSDDLARAIELMDQLNDSSAVGEQEGIHQALVRVFNDFVELSREHRNGHVSLLGYFGLMEALIVKDGSDSPRSLTHQFKTKMPLLSRRFARPLAIREFFDVDDPIEMWRLLYKLRSTYAHGGAVNFRDADFAPLRGMPQVFRYVRESLKRLIVLGLKEPALLADLRAC